MSRIVTAAGSGPDGERVGALFSATQVSRVLRQLGGDSKKERELNWLRAVATRVEAARPDIADALVQVIGVESGGDDVLNGLTIGEIGVCYEALVSQNGGTARRSSGQYFTPDDAAHFMASLTLAFGEGIWMDPCCGVGNLAWHVARLKENPGSFIRDSLILIDRDEVALRCAVALIAADHANESDSAAVELLWSRAECRDFLRREELPEHDFAIMNPPYARAAALMGYETAECRDLFAFFLERVSKTSKGFVAVTPASYLSAPKFQALRSVLDRRDGGGEILVFDNVPDTLFRGYKFGSSNTSKTNFVRAAITVSSPAMTDWRITPIIRWKSTSRATMFKKCMNLLAPRGLGPSGEWAKLSPGQREIWERLVKEPLQLKDIVTKEETPYHLDVALTPRYYISAAFRHLDRATKVVLYFNSPHERDRAAITLNSSIPYLWWRALDGGVTLPLRVLMSVPILDVPSLDRLVEELRVSEQVSVVTKLNAGRLNENVKHPAELVEKLNSLLIPGARDLDLLYSNDMFCNYDESLTPSSSLTLST